MTSADSKIFGTALGGGLVATGHYPGKARTPDELRADLEKAFSLIPGKHRLNLHACYGEFGGKQGGPRRNHAGPFPELDRLGEATMASAWTLIRPAFRIRRPPTVSRCRIRTRPSGSFWIEHCIRCREIGAAIGKALGQTCITNVWIPDGMKDTPADRNAPRDAPGRIARRDFQKNPFRRNSISTPSNPNCSASAPKVTSSARTNFISATP